jgi:multidrug efflux pump subunit AcrA (membrane-fusion protein)
MQAPRVTLTVTVVAILILCFFLVPLPVSRVRQQAVVEVQPEAVEKVFVPVPGILEHLDVRDGQWVQRGDILAEFRSLELEHRLGEARSDFEVRVGQVKSLQEEADQASDPEKKKELLAQIATAESERQSYELQVGALERERARLVLRAPRSGIVMSPPLIDDVGKLWEKGEANPFCSIGDLSQLRAVMPVRPADFRLLKEEIQESGDLDIVVRIQGRTSRTWKGKITQMPESEAKEVPLALTTKAGGPLAVKQGQRPNVYVPQDQQYLVGIDLVNSDAAIRPGNMAQVKIHCRWRPAAWWVWRTISQTFDLGLL